MRRSVFLAVVALAMPLVSVQAAETKIGPRGQVVVDGKPVVPLAVWVQPTYLFEYHRQLGMTCMVNAHVERGEFRLREPDIFRAAQANGLGLVTNYRDGAVAEPTVWAWTGQLMLPGRLERIRRTYADLTAKDPGRFVQSNIDAHLFLDGREEDFYREALRHTDAVISHVWPEITGNDKPDLRNVAVFVDRVRALCKDRPGGEVSIWPDINPHKWNLKRRAGGTEFPAPTRDELRFQIWLALIHGADGLCVFPITFDPFVYAQIPAQNEQELARNTRLIQRMAPALTAEESPLEIRVTSDRPDGILDVTTRRLDGTHYVFLVNGERREQTATLRAPGLGTTLRLEDAIKDRPVAATEAAYQETLPGLALRIWRLVPAPEKAAADVPASR